MANRYESAEFLTAVWKLGAQDELLPTSHGILDRALKECSESLPEDIRAGLSFGVTGVGLRCYELPDILLAAQDAMLTSEPNPTYLSTVVELDPDFAAQIVLRRGMSTAKAREIGGKLLEAVNRIRRDLAERASQMNAA